MYIFCLYQFATCDFGVRLSGFFSKAQAQAQADADAGQFMIKCSERGVCVSFRCISSVLIYIPKLGMYMYLVYGSASLRI